MKKSILNKIADTKIRYAMFIFPVITYLITIIDDYITIFKEIKLTNKENKNKEKNENAKK